LRIAFGSDKLTQTYPHNLFKDYILGAFKSFHYPKYILMAMKWSLEKLVAYVHWLKELFA